MVPRLSVLFFSLVLGMSAAHAQQNPFADFLKGLKGVFQGTPETRPDEGQPQQPSPGAETSDTYHIQRAIGFALEVTSSGTQTTWQNPSTGHHGVIVPSETFNTSTGQVCRKFERTLIVGSSVTRYEGTACRQSSGAWNIREETVVPPTTIARDTRASALEPSPQLAQTQPSADRQLVVETQRLLNELGYDAGSVDGIYGRRTQSAIHAFQQQQGLPEDGQVSESLLASLQAVASTAASPVSGPQDEATQALVNALEELDWAVSSKINHDVETTARAFADAYDIEQSRRIADFVLAPLTVIEQTIGLLALVKRPSEIASAMDEADGVLEIASILMAAGELLEVGGNLQLAIDGPTYGSLAETMLKEAASSSDPGEYAATVQLHLFGIGNRKSPIWARHRVGNKTEMVWGARAVKRQISDAIASLSKELSTTGVGSDTPTEEILGKLGEITTAIDWSKARNVPVPLGGALAGGTSAATETEIGSIGALEQARILALKNYDNDLHLKQIAVITNAGKAGFEALSLTVGYQTEAGQQLVEIHRTAVTPISVVVGAVTKFYSTNARAEINGLPHQMLLALPAELSNTWMLVDQTLDYVQRGTQALAVEAAPGGEQVAVAVPSDQLRAAEAPATVERQPSSSLKSVPKGSVVIKVTGIKPALGLATTSCQITLSLTNNTKNKFTDFITGSFSILDKDLESTGNSVKFRFYGATYPGDTNTRTARMSSFPCRYIGVLQHQPGEESKRQNKKITTYRVAPYLCTIQGSSFKRGEECGALIYDPDSVIPIRAWDAQRTADLQDTQTATAPQVAPRILADLGFTLSEITPALRQQLQIDEDIDGVVITNIREGSTAARAVPILQCLRPGDIILEFNQSLVRTPTELADFVQKAIDDRDYNNILFIIRPAGQIYGLGGLEGRGGSGMANVLLKLRPDPNARHCVDGLPR